MILDSIEVLRDEVNSGINKLQTDMDILNDFKVERQSIKESIQEIENSVRVGKARQFIGMPQGPLAKITSSARRS